MKMVAEGRKHGLATFIPNHNLLTLGVNLYLHITAPLSTVFNIYPVGQVAFRRGTLCVLYSDGIPCYGLHRHLSLTKMLLSHHGNSTATKCHDT